MFQNRMPGGIFGPKEDEDGKKSHNEDLHDLQFLPNFIQVSNE